MGELLWGLSQLWLSAVGLALTATVVILVIGQLARMCGLIGENNQTFGGLFMMFGMLIVVLLTPVVVPVVGVWHWLRPTRDEPAAPAA